MRAIFCFIHVVLAFEKSQSAITTKRQKKASNATETGDLLTHVFIPHAEQGAVVGRVAHKSGLGAERPAECED